MGILARGGPGWNSHLVFKEKKIMENYVISDFTLNYDDS